MWAHHFISCMEELGMRWRDENGAAQAVDIAVLRTRMNERWEASEWGVVADLTDAWTLQPCTVRAAPSSFQRGFKLYTYKAWFEREEWCKKQHWSYHLNKREHIRAVAELRLGSHWLAVQRGRLARPRRPRHQRCCTRCPGTIEDEAHLLECPDYEDLRGRFGIETCASPSDSQVLSVFTPETEHGWHKLAEFLALCRTRRTT